MSLKGRAIHALLARIGRSGQSSVLPTEPGDLVFLGDGRAHGGNWAEWFPDITVRTLGDLLLRVDELSALIPLVRRPRALVILTATGDLLGLGQSADPDVVAQKVAELVSEASAAVAPAPVIVVGVPPRTDLGPVAAAYNTRAARLVAERGGVFVDAPEVAQRPGEGYLVSLSTWSAGVYAGIASAIAPLIETSATSPSGFSSDPPATGGITERSRQLRENLFAMLPAPRGKIVLLGDSITEGGAWDGWLRGLPVVNRGIGGDRVSQMMDRLDTAIESPAAVSILGGTNDLRYADDRDPDSIADRFQLLVDRIRDRAPETPLLINSVLPRQAKYADRIDRLNDRYRHIAESSGAAFLDLWPVMATPRGSLRRNLTTDGLHLNAAGYRAWATELRPALESLQDGKGPSRD